TADGHLAVLGNHKAGSGAAAVANDHAAIGRRLDFDVLLRKCACTEDKPQRECSGATKMLTNHCHSPMDIHCWRRPTARPPRTVKTSTGSRADNRDPAGIMMGSARAPTSPVVPNQARSLPVPPWLVCIGARCWPLACTSDTPTFLMSCMPSGGGARCRNASGP